MSEKISKIALKIRQEVLKMAVRANGGHIAPAYSIADIIAEIYFDNILKYDPKKPCWGDRDYFILSKGHGVLALYPALAMAGFFPMEDLCDFCKPGSKLGSLAKFGDVAGIEASTGSLGHGLSYGIGIALALKLDKLNNRVLFILLGDGECEEGSVWEGFMAASHHHLDNLTVIIDNNQLQAMDTLEDIMSLGSFNDKLYSFGFNVVEINGHNYNEINKALKEKDSYNPTAVIAHTIKGKGVSFMENIPIWHYRVPKGAELHIALHELEMNEKDLGNYEDSVFRNII